jgi:vacuolar-type H+-ATPase subunit I/STV1
MIFGMRCLMNINKAFYKEIQDSLNSQYLSTEDFRIDINGERDLQVVITYLYNSDYYFHFRVSSGDINFTRSPGNMLGIESGDTNTKDNLMRFISGWLTNMQKEIIASPGLRELVEHKLKVDKKLSDLEASFKEIGKGEFSKAEVEDINEKLEVLRSEFAARLEEEIDDRTKLQDELRTMNKEIEFLKSQVQTLTKENWAKALFVKALSWRKRNPKALAAIATITRELLPDGVKQHISDDVVEVLAGSSNVGLENP